jgi:SAM-dependent methyltransferase
MSMCGDALDLGCGTGRHATADLVAAGFQVTGLVVSARSIEVARRELPASRSSSTRSKPVWRTANPVAFQWVVARKL